jgi:vitamin B12 transporter
MVGQLRRSYDHGRGDWQVAMRNVLTPFWVSRLSARRGHRRQQDGVGVRRLSVQDDPAAVRVAERALAAARHADGGYERREEHLKTTASFAISERTTNSIFGIYQLRIDDHALQGNLRHDDSNQYGGKTTGSIAYGYRVSPALRVTSRGMRPASRRRRSNDLYYPGFSNPDVKPETSKNFEGGIYLNGNLAATTLELRAIAYRNRVSQLIVFQCDVDFNCAPQNVNRATLEGVTLDSTRARTTARPSVRRSTSSRRRTT